MSSEDYSQCNGCGDEILKEDAVYDGNLSAFYCDKTCFNLWAYGNIEVLVDFYGRFIDG